MPDPEYIEKCRSLIQIRFEDKQWGAHELRKIEVMLEGATKDEFTKERIGDLFSSLEENPTSDRIKKACDENQHRAGGKIIDRSRYMPNPALTPEIIAAARDFCSNSTNNAWEVELYPFGEIDIFRWVTNMEITISHLRNLV